MPLSHEPNRNVFFNDQLNCLSLWDYRTVLSGVPTCSIDVLSRLRRYINHLLTYVVRQLQSTGHQSCCTCDGQHTYATHSVSIIRWCHWLTDTTMNATSSGERHNRRMQTYFPLSRSQTGFFSSSVRSLSSSSIIRRTSTCFANHWHVQPQIHYQLRRFSLYNYLMPRRSWLHSHQKTERDHPDALGSHEELETIQLHYKSETFSFALQRYAWLIKYLALTNFNK